MQLITFEADVLRVGTGGKKYRERKEITLEIPTRVTEVTLKMWADFTNLRDAAPAIFQDINLADVTAAAIPATEWTAFIAHALEAVYTLTCNREEIRKDDLLRLPLGSTAADGAGDSLLAILAIIMAPISEYQPKSRETFLYNNQCYAFYTDYLDQFDTEWIGKDLRTAEAVDALQFEQVFFQRDADGKFLMPEARYRTTLALLALLTRRVEEDGSLESPPIALAERTEWLDQRMVDLAGVSMDVGLDIDFFLPDSRSLSRRIRSFLLPGKKERRQPA